MMKKEELRIVLNDWVSDKRIAKELYIPDFIAHVGYGLDSYKPEVFASKFGVELIGEENGPKTAAAFFSERWIVGGQEGGNCWSDGGHYSVNSEPEVATWVLEGFIEEMLPDVGYRKYKKLCSLIKYFDHANREYYGNRTEYRLKYVLFEDIINSLSDDGNVE